jgi:shikimate kinase
MSSDRNIVITGFMGTGKTSVGQLVAARLNREFIDTDAEIVRRTGRAIPDIFAQDGEAAFRAIEGRLCRFLAAHRGFVIATGGGTLIDAGNRRVMLASGLVVCLSATPEAIMERIGDTAGERPMLRDDWRALLARRQAAYAAIPCQVDTTGKTPEAVAEEIATLWQQST